MRLKSKIFFSLSIFVLCAVCWFSGTAWADGEEKEKKLFFLSPTAGWYFPSSGKVKDAFGSSWGGFGVSINPEAFGWKKPDVETGGVRLSPYIGYFHAEEGSNEAHIIPLGIEARWTLKEWDGARTYMGVGLSGYGVKFEDRAAGIDTSWRMAGGGRIMLGADIAKWLNLNASYNAISDVEGYNFGGFSVGAKINFYF